jgi:biopolymer transport protein TolR
MADNTRKNPPFDPPPAPPRARAPRLHKKLSIVHSHDATRPAASDAVSDINITPLIDVMLVLLIIFMVVTPLTQRGLDIALPQTDTEQRPPDQRPPDTVVLTIDDTGMSVNKSPVASMEELDTRLKDIFQTRSDKTIFVKATGKVLYGRVIDAMDLAKAAGVERIGIISEKQIEQAGGAPAAAAAPAGTPTP